MDPDRNRPLYIPTLITQTPLLFTFNKIGLFCKHASCKELQGVFVKKSNHSNTTVAELKEPIQYSNNKLVLLNGFA